MSMPEEQLNSVSNPDTKIVSDLHADVDEEEEEEVDVEDEEEHDNDHDTKEKGHISSHPYVTHRVVRVRDPSIEGAPIMDFNTAGRYNSKTVLGACKKANNKIFEHNKLELGKTIWLLVSWKIPYQPEARDEKMDNTEHTADQKPVIKEKEEYESFFFTKIASSKPKKLYFYDAEMKKLKKQWKAETGVVEDDSSLVKLFRDATGTIIQFTNQQLKETTDYVNPITRQTEKRGPAHTMESAGFLYTRPSSELVIQLLDGVWTRTEAGQTSVIEPQQSPKDAEKHHVVEFKCESLEVFLNDDADEIRRVEEAEVEYAANPPTTKTSKRKRADEVVKTKPRRKRIMVAEEIKEMKAKKEEKVA